MIPHERHLYDALILAIVYSYNVIATALLDLEVDPNLDHPTGKRLGNISGRIALRNTFHSTPMHLACLHGQPHLVYQLLKKNAKCNIPDASGLYPLHLVASSRNRHKSHYHISNHENNYETTDDEIEEDMKRLRCIQLLLRYGSVPLSMKDGNKQTIIHAAARGGHVKVLEYVMNLWKIQYDHDERKKDGINWKDTWSRTPVHWTILNGHVECLKILLQMGCHVSPPKNDKKSKSHNTTKQSKSSSAAVETPLELCLRLYNDNNQTDDVIGKSMKSILFNAKNQSKRHH
jgi:ankyrin repeat protein